MKRVLRRRPSPALVVSIVALVVAMTGTGYAGTFIPDGSVTEPKIADGAVTFSKIAPRAVTTSRIGIQAIYNSRLQPSAVSTSKLRDDAVINKKIATGAVNADSIATGGVGNAELGNGAVTAGKLGTLTVRTSSVTVPIPVPPASAPQSRAAQANCNTGEVALSGGAVWDTDTDNQDLRLVQAGLTTSTAGQPTGFRARGLNADATPHTLTVQVLCLSGGGSS
jgi:hypothetical protein